MDNGEPPLEEAPDKGDYYCTACQENIGKHPVEHQEDVHGLNADDVTETDDYETYDTYRIEKKDGEYIAKDEGMGHFTPHVWMDVDGVPMCGECGAVKVYEVDDE